MTLYISATKNNKHMAEKTGFIYLVVSLFCVLFGAVYELFSHEVYSLYMLYSFVFPLAAGTLPFYTLSLLGKKLPCRLSLSLYHSGIATLTVGSIFEGVLEIYGTTNRLTIIYWIFGTLFVAAGILSYVLESSLREHNNS